MPDQKPPIVFISYSHKDAEWKDRLVAHLGGSQFPGEIVPWEDTQVKPGDDWRREIEDAIRNAAICVLLVSADFNASAFIQREEVPQLIWRKKNEGLRVVPVLVRPFEIQGNRWLRHLQALPHGAIPLSAGTPYEQDERLASVAKAIRDLLPGGGSDDAPPQDWNGAADRLRMSAAAATSRSLDGLGRARWREDLHVERGVEAEITLFVRSPKFQLFPLVGEMGTGKTHLLCNLASHGLTDPPLGLNPDDLPLAQWRPPAAILMISAEQFLASCTPECGIKDVVVAALRKAWASIEGLDAWPEDFGDVLSSVRACEGGPLVVILDGLDELHGVQEARGQQLPLGADALAELLDAADPAELKVITGSRVAAWRRNYQHSERLGRVTWPGMAWEPGLVLPMPSGSSGEGHSRTGTGEAAPRALEYFNEVERCYALGCWQGACKVRTHMRGKALEEVGQPFMLKAYFSNIRAEADLRKGDRVYTAESRDPDPASDPLRLEFPLSHVEPETQVNWFKVLCRFWRRNPDARTGLLSQDPKVAGLVHRVIEDLIADAMLGPAGTDRVPVEELERALAKAIAARQEMGISLAAPSVSEIVSSLVTSQVIVQDSEELPAEPGRYDEDTAASPEQAVRRSRRLTFRMPYPQLSAMLAVQRLLESAASAANETGEFVTTFVDTAARSRWSDALSTVPEWTVRELARTNAPLATALLKALLEEEREQPALFLVACRLADVLEAPARRELFDAAMAVFQGWLGGRSGDLTSNADRAFEEMPGLCAEQDFLARMEESWYKLREKDNAWSAAEHVLHNRGNMFYKQGLFLEAVRMYDAALSIRQDLLETYFNRGLAKTRLARYQEAHVDLRKVVTLNPNLAEAFYTRGLICEYRQKYQAAIKDYQKALEIDPGYTKAASQIAIAKGKAGIAQAASHGGGLSLLIQQAHRAYNENAWRKAICFFVAAHESGHKPTYGDLDMFLWCMAMAGQLSHAALQTYEAIWSGTNLDGKASSSLFNMLGILMSALGQEQRAERLFLAAIASSDDVVFWCNLANSYSGGGDFRSALVEANTARRNYPGSGYPLLEMGYAWEVKGELEAARACYTAGVARQDYNSPACAYNLAKCDLDNGSARPEQMARQFSEALALYETHWPTISAVTLPQWLAGKRYAMAECCLYAGEPFLRNAMTYLDHAQDLVKSVPQGIPIANPAQGSNDDKDTSIEGFNRACKALRGRIRERQAAAASTGNPTAG